MKKLYVCLISVYMAACTMLLIAPQPVSAQVSVFQQCSANPGSQICAATNDRLFGPNSIWNRILNILTFVIGAIAVLMIIVGALRYTISGGDSAGINSAKNTILYAVVGLVLAVMANAIVNFVLTNI